MGIDAILAGIVAARLWGWPGALAGAVFGFFLLCDLGYFAANLLKIPHGGWFPLAMACLFSLIVMTWRRGRGVLYKRLYKDAMPVSLFIEKLGPSTQRVAGTAVFMTGNLTVVPNPLLHNIKHNKVVHERAVLMNVVIDDIPYVPDKGRVEVERLGKGFFQVRAHYGFLDDPDVPRALELCRAHGLAIDPMTTSFFLGRETLVASIRPELGQVQERLFIALNTGAVSATHYFGLPADRVVELGTQIEI